MSIKTTNIVNGELKKIPLLYGVMLSKLSVAELRGIAFEVSLQCDVDNKYCSIVDYSRMIGILLDNAIEAASLSAEKSVLFEVTNWRGRQLVTILNSCDKPVDIEKIYESGYTTKNDHNGEGLHQVRLLVNKYQRRGYDIELLTSYADAQFSQVVKI